MAAIAVVVGIVLTGVGPGSASGPVEGFGVVDITSGTWYLRDPGSGDTTSFYFGDPGDYPMMGDWNCDGVDTPGLYRQSDGFVYLRNSNTQGVADVRFFFGNPGDVPLAGDFNGDGCDTVSVFRPWGSRVFVINELGADEGGLGAAEIDYAFGNPGDKPFVGDFDGDGIDGVGLYRESTGLVYFRNSHTQGVADTQFVFGSPGDRIMAGKWTESQSNDTVGIFRPSQGTVYLNYANVRGTADEQYAYGNSRMVPVSGNFGTLPGNDNPPPATITARSTETIAVAPPVTVAPTGVGVLWSGDTETGDLSQWYNSPSVSGQGTAVASTENPRTGTYGLKLTADGLAGIRMKVQRLGPDPLNLPTDAVYSAWYFIPFTGMRDNIFQFKQADVTKWDSQGNPSRQTRRMLTKVSLEWDGAAYDVAYRTRIDQASCGWRNGEAVELARGDVNLPVNQWFQIEMRYVWNANSQGRSTLRINGVEVWDLNGICTEANNLTYMQEPRQWAVNHYLSSFGNDSNRRTWIYIDDAKVSSGWGN